ncbi:MAG: hypothetical protein AAB842_01155 [Patescibacteria group bacterium]
MKKLAFFIFVFVAVCVAYSYALDFPALWPGGVGSSWISINLNGAEIFSVKGIINIGGKEYTQIQEFGGEMVSLLSGSTFDPWGYFLPKAIANPFLIFRVGDDGTIYGYARPYMEEMASEIKKYYEGVTDVSFLAGRDEIMLFSPNPTRFGGAGWTVAKFVVRFNDGSKKTLEVMGTASLTDEMGEQRIQKEGWPILGMNYTNIEYYSSDKENPDYLDFIFEGVGGYMWDVYVSKRGVEGISKGGIRETFYRKLVSVSLTPEPPGKGKDIPPAGKTTATWGGIKSLR